MNVDTSWEATRGAIALLRSDVTPLLHCERRMAADKLEALLAERDALRAQVERANAALREAGRALAAARQEAESAHAAAQELADLARGEEER